MWAANLFLEFDNFALQIYDCLVFLHKLLLKESDLFFLVGGAFHPIWWKLECFLFLKANLIIAIIPFTILIKLLKDLWLYSLALLKTRTGVASVHSLMSVLHFYGIVERFSQIVRLLELFFCLAVVSKVRRRVGESVRGIGVISFFVWFTNIVTLVVFLIIWDELLDHPHRFLMRLSLLFQFFYKARLLEPPQFLLKF